jgi:hypothetical protein
MNAPSLVSIAIVRGKWKEKEIFDLTGSVSDTYANEQLYPASGETKSRFADMMSPFNNLVKGQSNGVINTLCWQGSQFNTSTEVGKYPVCKRNKGHHGPFEYAGCAAIRRAAGGLVNPAMMPTSL